MTSAKFYPHDMRPTDGTRGHEACVACGRTLAESIKIIRHASLCEDNCHARELRETGQALTDFQPVNGWEYQAEHSLIGA